MSTPALSFLTLNFQAIHQGILEDCFTSTAGLLTQIRDVDSVKRFTGTKVVGGKGTRLNEVYGPREPEVARNSTAALAYQLLDPVVSGKEQAEYQG